MALERALDLHDVFVTPEWLARAEPLASRLEEAGHIFTPVRASLLDEIADADSPRGIVAVTSAPHWRLDAIPTGSTSATAAAWVFLDGIQDPGNLGAVARVAEATGCAGLVLSPGCVHPGHPRALRASAGSLLRLPVAPQTSIDSLAAHLQTTGPRYVALDPRGGEPPWQAALDGPTVLLVGAEGAGLSEAVAAVAELRVTAPLAGDVESLNLAVSAAVVLFERVRQRNTGG